MGDMVGVPAETIDVLREALGGSFAEMDSGTLRRMYGDVGVAALAVVDSVKTEDKPRHEYHRELKAANADVVALNEALQEMGEMHSKAVADHKAAQAALHRLKRHGPACDCTDDWLREVERERDDNAAEMKEAQKVIATLCKRVEDVEHARDFARKRATVAERLWRRKREECEGLRKDIRQLLDAPPAQMSYNGRLVPINSTGLREVIDEAHQLRDRVAELERYRLCERHFHGVDDTDHGYRLTCVLCAIEAHDALQKRVDELEAQLKKPKQDPKDFIDFEETRRP